MVFITDSFAWNRYIFVAFANKKMLLLLKSRRNTNLFPDFVKLIGYLASAVSII